MGKQPTSSSGKRPVKKTKGAQPEEEFVSEDEAPEDDEEEEEEAEVLNGSRPLPWKELSQMPWVKAGDGCSSKGDALGREFEWLRLLDEAAKLEPLLTKRPMEARLFKRLLRGLKRAKNNEVHYYNADREHSLKCRIHQDAAQEAEQKLKAASASLRQLQSVEGEGLQQLEAARLELAEGRRARVEAEQRNIILEEEVQHLRNLSDAILLREAQAAAKKAAEKLVQRNDASALPRLLPWLESLGLAEKAPLALRYCGAISAVCLEDLLEHFETTATGTEDFFRALNLADDARKAVIEALSKATKERRVQDQRFHSLTTCRGHAADVEKKRLLHAANAAEDEALMLGQKRNVEPRQLEAARVEAKRLRKKYHRYRSCASAATAAWVVVSAPIFDMQGKDVFDSLKRLQKGTEGLFLANDWPNSTNARKADAVNFTKIGEMKARWQDKSVFQEISRLVTDTLWWNLYKGTVKGNLRAAALGKRGLVVKAVCLDGGPISRVEAHLMGSIVEEAVLELRTMGFDMKIEIERFATLQDFEKLLEQQAKFAAQLDSSVTDTAPLPQLVPLPVTPPVTAEGLATLLEQQSKALSMLVESLWLFAQQKRSSLDKVQSANVAMLRLEAEQVQRSMVDLQWRVETTKLAKPLPDLEVDPSAVAFIRCSRSSSMLPLLPEIRSTPSLLRSPSTPSLPRSR